MVPEPFLEAKKSSDLECASFPITDAWTCSECQSPQPAAPSPASSSPFLRKHWKYWEILNKLPARGCTGRRAFCKIRISSTTLFVEDINRKPDEKEGLPAKQYSSWLGDPDLAYTQPLFGIHGCYSLSGFFSLLLSAPDKCLCPVEPNLWKVSLRPECKPRPKRWSLKSIVVRSDGEKLTLQTKNFIFQNLWPSVGGNNCWPRRWSRRWQGGGAHLPFSQSPARQHCIHEKHHLLSQIFRQLITIRKFCQPPLTSPLQLAAQLSREHLFSQSNLKTMTFSQNLCTFLTYDWMIGNCSLFHICSAGNHMQATAKDMRLWFRVQWGIYRGNNLWKL